jgi:phosphoglycerate dehydrogenase-like enzyme
VRLSRWGRSAYDTDSHWAAEAKTLASLVDVAPPGTDAEIVVVNSKTRVSHAVLDRVPSLRLLVASTSGIDHLDLGALSARGIVAVRLPMVRRDAVVEAALELLLTGMRQTGALAGASRAGRWARGDLPSLPIRTLRGARVGVVGAGVIGRRVIEVLRFLGAHVVASDPAGVPSGVESATSEAMLAGCDALTLHCSLTPSSRDLFSAAALSRARPGLVLVNTARGPLVDAGAAVAAVEAGRMAFLGLDVFPDEPWPDLVASGHPNIVFTPHAAGWHEGLPDAVTAGLVAAIMPFCRGESPPFRVA